MEGVLTNTGMVRVLGSMRDQVTVLQMEAHRGHSRELSMVIAKLDEARLWAIAYGESTGSHVILDRAKLLADATDKTVPAEATGDV